MLLRGDKEEDAKRRIEHDRTAFKPENIADVDLHINSETQNIEEVADNIYKRYLEILDSRNIKRRP